MRYIAGNNINIALKKAKEVLKENKLPIINYIIEEPSYKLKIYNEYIKICKLIDSNYKIAIKLSSFNFNYDMIHDLSCKFNNKDIKILIDAENSNNNIIYQDITNKLIKEINNDKLTIIKTYQMYRKDSFNQLNNDTKLFKNQNINFGIKLVRGAYWNTEKNNNQLFTNKNDTDFNYNRAIMYAYTNNIYTIIATHNNESINLGMLLNKLNHNKNKFDFAHLLDMNTNKYNSIKNTNNIHVYLPYGPYNKIIPYLIRRLYENIDTIKYMFK